MTGFPGKPTPMFLHLRIKDKLMGLLLLSALSCIILVGVMLFSLDRFSNLTEAADRATRLVQATAQLSASQEHFRRTVNEQSAEVAQHRVDELKLILAEEHGRGPYLQRISSLIARYQKNFQEMRVYALQLREMLNIEEALIKEIVTQIRTAIIGKVQNNKVTAFMADRLANVNEGALAVSCFILLEQLEKSQLNVKNLLLYGDAVGYKIVRRETRNRIRQEKEKLDYLLLAIDDISLADSAQEMVDNIGSHEVITRGIEKQWVSRETLLRQLDATNDILLKTIGDFEAANIHHFDSMKRQVLGVSFAVGLLTIVLVLSLGYMVTRSVITSLSKSAEALMDIDLNRLEKPLLPVRDLPENDELGQVIRAVDDMRLRLLDGVREREKQERELEKSEENLRITLDSIGDAVIATDTKGIVTRMNPVAEKLTGWARCDAVGKSLPEVFRIRQEKSDEVLASPVDRVLASGDIVDWADDGVLVSSDGTQYRIADSGAPLRSRQGGTIGVVLVFRDITDEIAMHEQLLHSSKMDAIGQLAGGIAHDFNNMLSGIMGATELLQITLPEDEKTRSYLAMIIESAERAAGLTRKLLAFARREEPVSTAIHAHETLKDSVALLQNTLDRSIQITLALEAESDKVIGDPSQLQSVFINLGINASHAMPGGGDVRITSRNTRLEEVYCRASSFDIKPGAYLDVEVCDTGMGISPENLHRIFEPFFSTKEQGKGTGLGLSTVFGTVQQHRGAITVYSELGSGTSFHVYLPLALGDVVIKPALTQIIRGSGSILVVDDEPVMRATAKAILEGLGYTVSLAENGRKGLETYEKNHENYDLVILDMIMPEMNGRACFAAMQKIEPSVRVILSSGFSREEDVEEMKRTGLCGFIRKPFRSAVLSQLVHDVMVQPH